MEQFDIESKEITLYHSGKPDRPLVVLNSFTGDGSAVVKEITQVQEFDFNLASIGNLNWEHDMTPWDCPPVFSRTAPFTGGADDYLQVLLAEILPAIKNRMNGKPSSIGIAGYSLAGLFAIYALYQTDVFDCAASMSGSLWFPGFTEYCLTHTMKRQPERVYLSLGDKEGKTRNHLMQNVQKNTETIAMHMKEHGIAVKWEQNPGNHFQDADFRSAKGILHIIKNKDLQDS